MRRNWSRAAIIAVLLSVAGSALGADADVKASREREMLRRTQEALRQSQAENAELAAQKEHAVLEADDKLKAATAQLDTVRKQSKSAEGALRLQLENAANAQSDLNRKLADANRQIATLTSQQLGTAGELKHTQAQLEASKASNTSCEAKNLQLYQYSQELMTRYQKKGVWASLAQKEPVTGIKDVRVENLLQEYQQKLDAQKIREAAAAQP
jgi:hypothetical protein